MWWRRWHKKKRRAIFQSVFTTSLLCICAVAAIAIIATNYFTYQFIVVEKGKSRVDVLQQISDSNTVNRSNMVNVMDMLYKDFYGMLTAAPTKQTDVVIRQKLIEASDLLSRMGMQFTIDIVMNDKRVFSNDSDMASLNSLTRTYWYIKHYSGETDTSWNLRFLDAEDITSYGLSYGRTIYGADGESCGVIVVTSSHEALFRAFQQLVRDGSTVYILDQNGIIVSHTNLQRVGNWMTNMEAFAEEYGYNSYKIISRKHRNVMLANYRDPDSGWVFVEEQNMNDLLFDGLLVLRNCMLAVLLGSLLAGGLAFVRVRKITDVISDFSAQIGGVTGENLNMLPVRNEYEETYVLSTTFNAMICRLQELIRDIQIREQEKQRTEYDFLSAQINPHFLSNTLLAIRSLISFGQVDRAGCMMNELAELLHIPSTPEIQFVPLGEEIHLVRNYISIMNCRTEKGVQFLCDIPQATLQIQVPRMILQPIIGNSFFHGFAEKDEDCEIKLQVCFQGAALCISVTDNGEGIPSERLEEIRRWDYTSDKTHHGIGLKNVRKRLKIIYGGRSDVHVESVLGKSTTVTVVMDHYQTAIRKHFTRF